MSYWGSIPYSIISEIPVYRKYTASAPKIQRLILNMDLTGSFLIWLLHTKPTITKITKPTKMPIPTESVSWVSTIMPDKNITTSTPSLNRTPNTAKPNNSELWKGSDLTCWLAPWQNHATQANITPVNTPITPSNRSIFASDPRNWAVAPPNAMVAKTDAITAVHMALMFLILPPDAANASMAINHASNPSLPTTNVDANNVLNFAPLLVANNS